VKTTVGRIIFNDVLAPEMDYENRVIDKAALKDVTIKAYNKLGNTATADILDRMKNMGFHFATQSGLTIALNDIITPLEKPTLMAEADQKIAAIDQEYQDGLITDEERDKQVIGVWTEVNDKITGIINRNLPSYGNLHLMAGSGAKGSIAQIKQMAGMRGLMADPQGQIIPLPIKSNFREGLTVMEYFISTHGARKGLADTALRTADSGYLTRRLIDVAQDVIVLDHDCGTPNGVVVTPTTDPTLPSFRERLLGRVAAQPIVNPTTGEVLAERNQEIDEKVVSAALAAGVQQATVRIPLTCDAPRGICQLCYGRSLARGRLVSKGEAVGIIAAQSIGEPGTQLTMRTFHTGGVVGRDITSGLPRVEEIFEARVPKGVVPIAESDGIAEVFGSGDNQRVKVVSMETYTEEYKLPEGFQWVVNDNETVEPGEELARPEKEDDSDLPDTQPVRARIPGRVMFQDGALTLYHEEQEEREYAVPAGVRILVETGQRVAAGDALADGLLNPQDILRIRGREAVERYLTNEVQRVYRSQGVNIHDKHVEVIVRQMLRRVTIEYSGDTDFGQDEFVDRFLFETVNAGVIAQGGEPATARPILLGVTKASLNTESFLAAASFQETTRILTQDALLGKVDYLRGLKENVILGRLIPARYEFAEAELQRIRASAEVKLFRRTEEDEFGGIAVLPAEGELGDQDLNGAFGDHGGHMDDEPEPSDDDLLKDEDAE
jgi:DNA-directed RNA polymerase subunit beta'